MAPHTPSLPSTAAPLERADKRPGNSGRHWSLVLLSALVLAATLTAGLWPFSFHPHNRVVWAATQGGLWFAGIGLATSKGQFEAPAGGDGFAMELWVEPNRSCDSSALLTFHRGRRASIQIRQSCDDVVFASYQAPDGRPRQVFVDHVFRKRQRVFITLVSAGDALDVYIDGSLRKSAGSLGVQRSDFTGNLIVGNAHNVNMSWTGTFRGLALYNRTLPAAEIGDDYRLWQQDPAQLARKTAPAAALYLFNEGQGTVVHNAGRSGPDLLIPDRYSVTEPTLLEPFWREFRPNRAYALDIAVNILGLVPLGFCVAALRASLKPLRHPILYAAIFGLSVSLTIELLQAYMPTRSSGSTDLITNTVGTALGAWLHLRLREARDRNPA